MEGGNIVRRIGGESIKRAKKSLILESTHDNLTFYSAKQVVMSGEQGGVEYLNDYKPPEPLQVIHIEGPLNEEGEKVSTVEKGKSYKIKITQFNRELKSPAELMKIKWSLQLNEDAVQLSAKTIGKQEVTLDISKTDSLNKITIYAYISNWKKEGKCEVNVSTKQGGIHTRFYDEQGQQIYDIPKKLQKAFNEEYGIKIAYDKENEMLYYKGECAPAYEKISPTAIAHWKRELSRDQISKGKLLFGYNFGYEVYSDNIDTTYDKDNVLIEDVYAKLPVNKGIVPGFRKKVYKKYEDGSEGFIKDTFIGNIACIDLGDFEDNLMVKFTYYKLPSSSESQFKEFKIPLPELTPRHIGLTRVLEHEFIGHVLLKLTDDKYDLFSKEYTKEGPTQVEAKLCNIIRREIEIPDRISYGGIAIDPLRAGRSEIEFGYLTGSNEYYSSNINSRDTNYSSPPRKYPRHQGIAIIDALDVKKLVMIKNIIKIKYVSQHESFTFS